ncbi:MAG TPA: hypothetical protein VGQ74_11070 [Methylomirabilota bacterium]|jgi:hypothetical protein|nr:hypothetical protein [Methylomirabilota bacterium]
MTLEGWVPQINDYMSLQEVVEFAFDYRGNTTVVKNDGSEIVGYIFNRNSDAPEPFIQLFDERGDGPFNIPYRDIATIKFTGKDTAAGNSWKAWVERKEKEKALRGAASGADRLGSDPGSHGG